MIKDDKIEQPTEILTATFISPPDVKVSLITRTVSEICDECNSCEVYAIDPDTDDLMILKSSFCTTGDGYISVSCHDSEDCYLDSCKLKLHTDTGLPYNYEVITFPDCNCA